MRHTFISFFERPVQIVTDDVIRSESEMADGKNRGEETQGEWRLFGIARNTMRPPQDYPQPPLLIFLPAKPFSSFAFPALERGTQFRASGLPDWTFNLARMIKQFPNISIKPGTQSARASPIVLHFFASSSARASNSNLQIMIPDPSLHPCLWHPQTRQQ